MRAQTLITILVWVAVFGFTRVVSNDLSDSQKTELANKLNMLMHHSGWRSMDVRIKFNDGYRLGVIHPVSEILEDMSSNRNPFDNSNVEEKCGEIWLALSCKFAEIIYNYKTLVEHLVEACKDEERETTTLYKNYGDCFDLVLIKLDSASSGFRSMRDALELLYSIGNIETQPKHNVLCVMVATQQLADFTKTIRSNMWSKWETTDFNDEMIDDELASIDKTISDVFDKHIKWFLRRRCITPSNRRSPAPTLEEELLEKIGNRGQLTKLEYIGNQIDRLVDTVSGDCFSDLGFAYDGTGNVMFRNN